MTSEEAYAGYRKYKQAFEDAGIPWNKKGSPHRLLLKSKWFLQQLPLNKMIQFTARYYAPKLAENICRDNPLLRHLMKAKGA